MRPQLFSKRSLTTFTFQPTLTLSLSISGLWMVLSRSASFLIALLENGCRLCVCS